MSLLLVFSALGVGEERFYGGSYDGYAEGVYFQSDPVEFASRFSGGSYDGYAEGVYLQSDPFEFASRFSGGAYDGYADASVTNQPSLLMQDSDGDQLVDWWELVYADGLDDLSGSGDRDQDGAIDLHEMIADTNPTNDVSYFCITAVSNNSLFTVYFNSSSNRLYTLLGCSNLVMGVWTNIPGAGPEMGVGGLDFMQDTNDPPKGTFYRLKVELPEGD